jgi:hypothetical protein
MLSMTVAVKTMDVQRWICRINVFSFTRLPPTTGGLSQSARLVRHEI